tara:strand:+ start:2220 stop:2537 length:318 start_codon:yes stop_codon:yes gene_type:complete
MIFFIIGYTIMFLNEGFVILRHVSPWFAEKRKQLHDTFGREKIKRIHGFTDWSWIGLIALGYYLDFANWKTYTLLLAIYWGTVAIGIYLPMLIRRIKNKPTGYVK